MDLATATDLTQWAQRRDAQAVLPQLVRRLITATADGLTRISVRAGEGVALPGWDGVAEAVHPSAFVPVGLSVWEMGVGDPGPKANEDYRKRTDEPGEADPATTTFVFVTPRRWSGKDAWVSARKDEGVWKAVIAYDADGGEQERALAERYREHAAFAGMRWPRTAAMLVRIAESLEREAVQNDRDAELTEDTWR